jgi:hypothetical protein
MLSRVLAVVAIVCVVVLIIQPTERYDYDRENPNALQHGQIVAGTVYSDYPNDTPGLGWIL